MKVLFLNNFYYLRGGSERVLFEEMRMLKEAGHDVAIFTRRYPLNQTAPHELFFPAEIQRDKYSVSLAGLRTVKEIVYSSSARHGLVRLIDAFRPDLVHAHNIYGGLSTSVLDALKTRKIPALMTLHDLKLLCPSYLMLNHGRICERCKGRRFFNAVLTRCHKDSRLASAVYAMESYFSRIFRKYDPIKLFIAPSLFLLNKHLEFGFDEKRFLHVPNPVCLDDQLPNEIPRNRLLYFGRISQEKGIRTLLSAFIRTRADMQLHIAGNGPDLEAMKKIIPPAQRDRIKFMGYLTSEPLRQAIDSARAVILPSECYENAPMAILESFSRGKPVIGARLGGIPEIVDDGINGFLFKAGNVRDLQKKLEWFMTLPDSRVSEMGNAALKKIKKEYSAAAHYERLMRAYVQATGVS